MDIRNPHPLLLEAQEVRDVLVLAGGDEQLIRKLNDLLALPFLHGGQAEKLRRLIERAKS